jgi:hypothetical protein
MRHTTVLLWCAASIIFSPVTTTLLYPAPSRLHLLRALENAPAAAPQDSTLSPVAQSVSSTPLTPSPSKPGKPRPPCPIMPAKPTDLTREQGIIFDLLVSYSKDLQDPLKFTTAANKLKEMIDGKMMGTDPRTVIAQRGELQQALLAAALNALSKKQLTEAKMAGKLTDDQLKAAITAGSFLHREINIIQWLRLDIEKNPILKDQYLNAQDSYDEYEEEPISPNETSILGSTIQAIKGMSSYSLAGGATAAFSAAGALLATYKKWRDAKISPTSPAAREAVTALATADIPEGLEKKQREELREVILDTTKDLASGTNPVLAAELTAGLTKVREDIDDTQLPRDEMLQLSKEVAIILYANNTTFTAPNANTLNPQFLSVIGATGELTVRIARMNTLLAQSIAPQATNKDLASPETQTLLEPLLYIPDTFFIGIKNKLDDKSLTPLERDNLIMHATTFLTLIKRNQYTFGVASVYNGKSLDAMLKQWTDLTLGSTQESALFTQLQTLLADLKVVILRMYEQTMLPAPSFVAPADATGAKITYTSVIGRNPDFTNKTAAELYSFNMQKLISLITENQQAIIDNEKLFMLLLDGQTVINPADVSPALRKKLSAPEQMATETFFELKTTIAAAVEKKTGKKFGIVEFSGLQKEILMPLYAFLDRVYINRADPQPKLKQKLFDSTDTVLEMIQALSNFTMLLSATSRPDVVSEIANIVALRDALFKPLIALPADFFTLAGSTIKNDVLRYSLSEHGYKMSEALLILETPTAATASANTRIIDALTRLKSSFKSLSFMPKEKESIITLQASIQSINEAVKALATAGKEQQGPLIRQYTSNMITLISICDDADGRTLIGRNYFANELFFTSDGIFLSDVPEQIESDGLRVTIDLLKSILDNPKEFNYESRKNKPTIEYTLKELIKDAEQNELSAAEKLPKAAQDLYILLNAAFLNLKDIKTYTQGIMNIYAAIKEKEERKLIGENPLLYNAFFSTTGVFCLPEGVRLDTPSAKLSGLDEFAIQAGFLLFECIKKNPNELGCDDMAKGFIEKLYQFFNKLKTNQVAANPEKAAAAETSVTTTTTALSQQAAASPSGSVAQQNATFISEHAAELVDPTKMISFSQAVVKMIDSKSKRTVFKENPALKALFFSEKGIFPDTSKFPQKYIPPKGVKALRELYDIIADNPNEFGIKEDKSIQLALERILKFIKGFEDRIEDKENNYEDMEAYEYMTPEKDGKTRFVPRGLQILTGNIDNPTEVLGPQITDESLIKNDWALRQRDIYKYIYNEGYRALRSPYMSQFTATLNTLETMCKELDQDESLPLLRPSKRLSEQGLDFRRILNKKPLEEAFHGAVIGLAYLPNDILDEQWRDARIKAIKFYEYLLKNPKKFEIKAEQQGRINNIITWLTDPKNKAPDRIQAAALDGDLAQQQLLQQGMMSPTAGTLMTSTMMPGMGMGMMGGVGMAGPVFNGTGSTLYDRKGANSRALAASPGGMAMMPGMGMGMMPAMGMGAMGSMGMYNPAAGVMMGGMGTTMMPGMGMGMMPMMGMGGIDVASQIKTAMLEKEVADMRREQQDAKIEALSRGRSLDSFSDTSSLRDDAASSFSRSSFSSTGGMSVMSDGMSTTASFNTMVDTSDDEFKPLESDSSILQAHELASTSRLFGSISSDRKKEAREAYQRSLKANDQLLMDGIRAIQSNEDVAIKTYTKELTKQLFENDNILIMWQVTPTPDAFFTKVFSRTGILISPNSLSSTISSKSLKEIKNLYKTILSKREQIRIPQDAIASIKFLIKTLEQKLDERGDTQDDSTLSDESDSEEVETDKKVASLIKFFTESSKFLIDPELAGDFARQALAMISQGWFAKRWKNITRLGRSNTGLIKKRDAVHSAVFSEQGLLKTRAEFNQLHNKISGADLTAIRELYVYIQKNPGLVGISDEPHIKATVTAILTWLSRINPNDGSQTFDPYVVDSIVPEEPDMQDEESSNAPRSPGTYAAQGIKPRALTEYTRDEEVAA